jgi:YVTN family beta-propeller protein
MDRRDFVGENIEQRTRRGEGQGMTIKIGASAIGLSALCLSAALAGCEAKGPPPTPSYRLYISDETSGDVTVVDEPSHAVVSTVSLGKRPRGMQATADGRQVFVALSGSPIAGPGVDEDKLPPPDKAADGIGVFNTASLQIARMIKGVSNPEQLGLSSNGKLYAADEETGSLTTLSPDNGSPLGSLAVGKEPEGLAVSPDGKFVYVTAESDDTLVIVDAASGKVARRLPMGKRPRGIAFSPDGTRAYVTAENGASVSAVDTASQEVVKTAAVPGAGAKPMGVVVSPDNKRLYVTTGRGGGLVAFDAATLAPQASVAVGQRPWGVAVSPDGRFVYTANGQSNDVSVVETAGMTVTARIKAGGRPWGVVVAPKYGG